MYKYFIYFLIFFASIIAILAIIIPLILLTYLGYILLFQIPYKEIDIWHRLNPYFTKWLTAYTNIDKNFPVQFEDEGKIDPSKQYLYIFYPHGMYAVSQIIHVSSNTSALSTYFKNAVHGCHSLFYSIPLIRELSLLFKGIPVNREYIDHYLQAGKSVSINPSGLKDVQYCTYRHKNTDTLYLKGRKGFIHAAKDNSVPIVPIYCWNEQQLMRHTNSFDWLTRLLKSVVGINFDCNVLQGMSPTNMVSLLSMTFGSMPGSKAYMGKPIEVKDRGVDEIHEEFIESIKALFEIANKEHGGQKTLEIT